MHMSPLSVQDSSDLKFELMRFTEITNPNIKQRYFDRFEGSQAQIGGYLMGMMAIEVATNPLNRDKGKYWYKAEHYLDQAEANAQYSDEIASVWQAKLNLPVQRAIYYHNRHPNDTELDNLMEGCSLLIKDFGNYIFHNKSDRDTKGVIGEVAVQSLLLRYAVEQIGDGLWTPIQSLHSQNHSANYRNQERCGWDLSIFTGNDPTLTYKLQVKTSEYGFKPKKYTPELAKVVIDDLKIEKNTRYSIHGLITELKAANEGLKSSQISLDKRTEKLLRILDSVEAYS